MALFFIAQSEEKKIRDNFFHHLVCPKQFEAIILSQKKEVEQWREKFLQAKRKNVYLREELFGLKRELKQVKLQSSEKSNQDHQQDLDDFFDTLLLHNSAV